MEQVCPAIRNPQEANSPDGASRAPGVPPLKIEDTWPVPRQDNAGGHAVSPPVPHLRDHRAPSTPPPWCGDFPGVSCTSTGCLAWLQPKVLSKPFLVLEGGSGDSRGPGCVPCPPAKPLGSPAPALPPASRLAVAVAGLDQNSTAGSKAPLKSIYA